MSGPLELFLKIDLGEPLHSFVICGSEIHHIEEEMYKYFHYKETDGLELKPQVEESKNEDEDD